MAGTWTFFCGFYFLCFCCSFPCGFITFTQLVLQANDHQYEILAGNFELHEVL